MRYRLRTLLIVLAIGPPLLAWLFWPDPPLEGYEFPVGGGLWSKDGEIFVLNKDGNVVVDKDGNLERAVLKPIARD